MHLEADADPAGRQVAGDDELRVLVNRLPREVGRDFHEHRFAAGVCGLYGGEERIERWAILEAAETGCVGRRDIEHEDPIYEGSEEKARRGLLLAQRYLEPLIT